MKTFSSIIFLLLLQHGLMAEGDPRINPSLLENEWDAEWIGDTRCQFDPAGIAVLLFRKEAELTGSIPDEFLIHVSADNRYLLYVNGRYAGSGPARSEPEHWNFETYDIASFLVPGKNLIAAKVWNYGHLRAWGQLSVRTGFILQGNSHREAVLNSGPSWKVSRDESLQFESTDKAFFSQTMGVPPCERFNASLYPWDWEHLEFDDRDWGPASSIGPGLPKAANPNSFLWSLVPRTIPFMEDTPGVFARLVRSSNLKDIQNITVTGFEVTIPAHTKASILLDAGEPVTAVPTVKFSRGKGSEIKLVYNEALYDEDGNKPDRNLQENLILKGNYDYVYPDGGQNRTYNPHWHRSFRYMELIVQTKEEPLILHEVSRRFLAYPFRLMASFRASDPVLEQIFQAGWLTARLSAHETYEDCPYYEQLQYFGDLGISCPVTVLLSGDSRLLKNAILHGEYGRKTGHLTNCAYPSQEPGKIIPSFSLAWIDMILTYSRYTGDLEFASSLLPSVKSILDWYSERLNSNLMLGPMPYWNFIDCTSTWPWDPEKGSICEPPGTKTGNSAILSLQYSIGLQTAAGLYRLLGKNIEADSLENISGRINEAVRSLCYDKEKGLFADSPEYSSYSQHVNTFAALAGVLPVEESRELISRLQSDPSLIPMSLQFQAYLHRAMTKHGMKEQYLDMLEPWKELIRLGFKTFPEYPVLNTRSDCHPWNAFPSYELLQIVGGINYTAPGIKEVRIEPHPGKLEWFEASMPAGNGVIEVQYRKTGRNRVRLYIEVPGECKAVLAWQGKEMELKTGINTHIFKY